ncbi:xanthine dehydrogenase family protein molybdopterin-binding subunit [Elongatibacter sediminis]|uniref:Molybdopterin cofactor-binding domain-containing protein n=1 Tax=Elongatibacter sediminis TaxID=3119006 RepID=A0AAW9RGN4_9GAMM
MSATRLLSGGVSRRDFIKHSSLAIGGLTVSVALPLSAATGGDTGFQPNAFVHVAPDGTVTLWCGRCEMGQGISTALPAAVADELEADWARVTVLQADGDKKYGPQGTGGSRSINIMLEPMRQAGAAAREMLVAAAAQAWGLAATDCYADNHVVRNRQDDRELGYGELADAAAALPVPEEPALKSKDEFRYIGKPLPRHDQDEVVVGTRVYGADVKLPSMKYAAIRHVPVMGGSLKSLDKSALTGIDGITAVVEIPRYNKPFGTLGGVAVVADNTWLAQQAVGKLDIEWERGPHGDYDTDAYKQELVRNVEAPGEAVLDRGDVDAAFENATVRHAATYVGGHLSHSPMEPMASAAWVTDERCEIWASTQDPQGIQNTIADYLGRQPEDIIVHVMMAGGAFGRKFKCDYVTEAVALSKAIKAPVQLTWSREEDTRTGYYHSCSAQHIEAGVDAEGNLTGWLHRAAFPPISSLFDPSVTRPGESELAQVTGHPYGVPNLRVESGESIAHTRIGWYRAVYDIFWGFAFNVFTDELAHKAGADPLAFYRRIYERSLATAPSDEPRREQAQRSLAVLNKAAEMGEWGRSLPDGHGLGLAVHHSYHSYTAMAVHAEVQGDEIHVHRVDCAVDCGLVLNPDIATAQMEGAVVMGLGLALRTELKFKDGAVVNSNFHDYPVLRIHETPPVINVAFIGQDYRSTGLGEPGVPTFAPALSNAVFAASGKRYRQVPFAAAEPV